MSDDVEAKLKAGSQLLNTVLSGLLVMGISWLLLEVNESRERWARVEERIAGQSAGILDIKRELRVNIEESRNTRMGVTRRLRRTENRLSVLESRHDTEDGQ